MQLAFAEHLKERRKKAKMSREALAKKSTVPASTIKSLKLLGSFHSGCYYFYGKLLPI